MPDLPDYYTQIIELEAEAYSIRGGADASKPASPEAKDVYLATDTQKLYYCIADGAWADYFFGAAATITLTNKTLTTPVIASIYQDAAKTKLLTLPAATDTLVGRATTDTLTNKTLTSPTIQGTVAAGMGLTMPAFTMGGTLTMTGQAIDVGSGNLEINTTGLNSGLIVTSTQDGNWGALVLFRHHSASPAIGDIVSNFYAQGKDDGATTRTYGSIQCVIVNPAAAAYESKWRWYAAVAAASNIAMELSGAGQLTVDQGVTMTDASGSISGGTDLSGSRAINTNYQNSTKIRLVIVSFDMDADGYCNALTDSATPASVIVARQQWTSATAGYSFLFFLVQPSHYYRVDDILANATIDKWIEYNLF